MYTRSLGPKKTLSVLGELVQLCAKNGGPIARQVAELALAGKFKELLDYELVYKVESDVNDLICARQILGFYSKYEQLDLGVDKEETAYTKFIEAEKRCKETNHRLTHVPAKGLIASVEHYAMRKIARVLGDVPSLAALKLRFGPGANTSVNASCTSPRVKLSARLDCNHNMVRVAEGVLSELPLLVDHHGTMVMTESREDGILETSTVELQVTPGQLMFVPKNALIYRVIIKEPGLAGIMQLGFGTYMKERMRLHGLDLTDQEANRKLALQASIDGINSTVDMSMASDLLARETVFRLLPIDWACRLDDFRSTVVESEHGSIVLEKFSSMGNGYTFELESLIFWALAIGCCNALELAHKEVGCYGDDVIIPAVAYDLFAETLEYYGFLINHKKSFKRGPFRESCGADFFRGIDIRPFYVKEHLTVRSLFTMHNWFVRHCEFELASLVKSHIPEHMILMGPDGYGDGHLVGTHTLRRNRMLERAGWCGGYFDTYVLRSARVPKGMRVLPGDWVFPAYSVYTRSGELSPTDPDVIRGSCGFAKVSIYSLTTGVFR